MSGMFENCGKLKSLDLSHIITDDVYDMSYAFNNCSSLETLVVRFRTENVKYMQNMFSNCISLTSLNIGTFFTGSALNFTEMFENDRILVLTMDTKTCANVYHSLPSYVTVEALG